MWCLGIGGCGAVDRSEQSQESSAPTSSPAPAVLPELEPFDLESYEPAASVKSAAVDFLEASLTYPAGEQGLSAARERVPESEAAEESLSSLQPLLDSNAGAAAKVLYPQLGGLTDDRASVMVILDFRQLADNEITAETRVLDVRLRKLGEKWKVKSVESVDGQDSDEGASSVPPTGEPSANAALIKQILETDAITMADTAAEDLRTGTIDPRPLKIVQDFSRKKDIGVTVIRTGHPRRVFGAKAVSNHSKGKAVDIWEIDGRPVAWYAKRPPENNPARELMEEALKAGSDEVGGPWAFSTESGSTFTNTVHQDHVHIGFKK